jgi:hypothetical protein
MRVCPGEKSRAERALTPSSKVCKINKTRAFGDALVKGRIAMQIAMMSDIHSNHTALTACLNHALALGADQFLFLGDTVSDCAYPEKTLSLLHELSAQFPCRFIAGNREEYMLHHLDGADDQ